MAIQGHGHHFLEMQPVYCDHCKIMIDGSCFRAHYKDEFVEVCGGQRCVDAAIAWKLNRQLNEHEPNTVQPTEERSAERGIKLLELRMSCHDTRLSHIEQRLDAIAKVAAYKVVPKPVCGALDAAHTEEEHPHHEQG